MNSFTWNLTKWLFKIKKKTDWNDQKKYVLLKNPCPIKKVLHLKTCNIKYI